MQEDELQRFRDFNAMQRNNSKLRKQICQGELLKKKKDHFHNARYMRHLSLQIKDSIKGETVDHNRR